VLLFAPPSSEVVSMGKARGTSILGTLDYVSVSFGQGAVARVISELPEQIRREVGESGRSVLPGAWYPCSTLSQLTRTADRLLGAGDLALARAAGKHVAFADVNRFFRWLFKLVGPQTLFSRAGSVWNNYYDTGHYVLEGVEASRASLRIEGWEGGDEVLCKRLEGWVERAVEMTLGTATNPAICETHHQAFDARIANVPFCRFEARWES
jgi:hypothetical protein